MTEDHTNHPAYYNKGNIECIEAIGAATSDLSGIEAFCIGNAIKYVWRWRQKGSLQDLDKAIWYIGYIKKLREK